jgi:hypothetical protein
MARGGGMTQVYEVTVTYSVIEDNLNEVWKKLNEEKKCFSKVDIKHIKMLQPFVYKKGSGLF